MPLLNPKQMQFVRKVRGTSLTSAALAYYKSRSGGYTVQRKRGATSQKDPVARRLNLYHGANPGSGRYITHIYAQKSRVMRGTENLLAVKLNTGEKGWITAKGRFMSEQELRNVLHSVDCTSPASVADISLLDLYDSLTAQQKAEFAEKVQDFDWDAMFEEMYPKDGEAGPDAQMDAYFELLETIGDIKGWQR